ncbi:hypothetical protein VTL71DRAFT_9020 [Oculimacula yallundae]|uniref:Clr5 domain-containing protein n=1 Tax=Oculimacula yallundae TaxID=86028 RepID=A0ABR4BW73_9HELO
MASTKVRKQFSTSECSSVTWARLKDFVEFFYVAENLPAKEVLRLLLRDFNFNASENQFKKQLKKWNFDKKNVTADTMVQIARARAKRSLEDRQSVFRVNKRPVADRNIDKFLDRRQISLDDLLEMGSPIDGMYNTQVPFRPVSAEHSSRIACLVTSPAFSVSSPPAMVSLDETASQLNSGLGFSLPPTEYRARSNSPFSSYAKTKGYNFETIPMPPPSLRTVTHTVSKPNSTGYEVNEQSKFGEGIAIPQTVDNSEKNYSVDRDNDVYNSHNPFHSREDSPEGLDQNSELHLELGGKHADINHPAPRKDMVSLPIDTPNSSP